MQAMFVAHGPFSVEAKAQHQRRSNMLARAKGGWHSTSEDSYIMETFPNVEIYNLVIRLLGIGANAANNNGTVGFWDQYL